MVTEYSQALEYGYVVAVCVCVCVCLQAWLFELVSQTVSSHNMEQESVSPQNYRPMKVLHIKAVANFSLQL